MKNRALPSTLFSAFAFSCLMGASTAWAKVTVVDPDKANYNSSVTFTVDGKKYKDTLTALTYVSAANKAFQKTLEDQFPTWKFTFDTKGLNGALNVNKYQAINSGSFGAALLDATYEQGKGDPLVANLRFVQDVVTNAPLGGGGATGYIDPLPNDDTLPFYWTTTEDTSKGQATSKCGKYTEGGKTASSYHFGDCSNRKVEVFKTPIDWSGMLLLASWTDPGGKDWRKDSPPEKDRKVTIYDGIEWGYQITSVPEPSPWMLMLAGFFGLGSWRYLSGRGRAAGLP